MNLKRSQIINPAPNIHVGVLKTLSPLIFVADAIHALGDNTLIVIIYQGDYLFLQPK